VTYYERAITVDKVDTFDGVKPRFLNRGNKRRSVSTLSIPRASDRGVEWVDLVFGGYPGTANVALMPLVEVCGRCFSALCPGRCVVVRPTFVVEIL
jgi:hypothetical protein